MKSQAETIAELNTRCEGQDQFEKFDCAFRASLTVPKAEILKKEARQEGIGPRSGRRKRANIPDCSRVGICTFTN